MEKEIIVDSNEYKKGFSDAIFHVIRILNDNANLQQRALISLLNTVIIEVNKNQPLEP